MGNRITIYYRFPSTYDGGSILDQNVINRLDNHVGVNQISLICRRFFGFPLWGLKCNELDYDEKDFTVVSHESLIGNFFSKKVDIFIVHNFSPSFHSDVWQLKIFSFLYNIGAKRYYKKAFKISRCIMFISRREMRFASSLFPQFDGKFCLSTPGVRRFPVKVIDIRAIYITGTSSWFPKKFNWLGVNEVEKLTMSGFRLSYDLTEAPAFAVINELFDIGIKLKLIEMISANCFIFVPIDLSETISQISPGYNRVFYVNSFDEMYQIMLEISSTNLLEYNQSNVDADWDGFVSEIVRLYRA